jgi:hypothetical protein
VFELASHFLGLSLDTGVAITAALLTLVILILMFGEGILLRVSDVSTGAIAGKSNLYEIRLTCRPSPDLARLP